MITIICKTCGKEKKIYPSGIRRGQGVYCSTRCMGIGQTGKNNSMWNGGQFLRGGYVYLLRPDHHKADRRGYVKRCVLVAEEKIGRHLIKGEEPHHINGNKQDDRPDNILVVTHSEHVVIHKKGVPFTAEHRKNLSESVKRSLANGRVAIRSGRA